MVTGGLFDEHFFFKVDQKCKNGWVKVFWNWLLKNCILRKTILKFMNLIFGIFEKKINFKTFYAQNYSQKVCSRSILNRPILFEVCFTGRRHLLTLWHLFTGITALGVFVFYSHSKTKEIKNFHLQIFIFWEYVLEWYFSQFLQKTKTRSFWPEFCFFTFL